MIYRPFTDYEVVNTGLWWSDNPFDYFGPENPSLEMNLDILSAEPLSKTTLEFINSHWAVLDGKLSEIGDVFQSFDNREIVASDRVAKVILELEPGKHDVIRIPKAWSFGSKRQVESGLFFINVYQTARTMDLEKSSTYQGKRRSDGREYTWLDSISKDGCFVHTDKTNQRHLWRDDVTLSTFMSEKLVKLLLDAQVKGFDFIECNEHSI